MMSSNFYDMPWTWRVSDINSATYETGLSAMSSILVRSENHKHNVYNISSLW